MSTDHVLGLSVLSACPVFVGGMRALVTTSLTWVVSKSGVREH